MVALLMQTHETGQGREGYNRLRKRKVNEENANDSLGDARTGDRYKRLAGRREREVHNSSSIREEQEKLKSR